MEVIFGVTIEKGKAYHITDGKCEEFVYKKKSDKLSKLGELAKKYPEGIIEVHDLEAVMR